MSFMRCGYPLRYFKKGETEYYVFPGEYKGKEYIEDYSSDYKDDKSFAELIGNFVKSATGNEEYAFKIVKVLAKKLGIENELRKSHWLLMNGLKMRLNEREVHCQNLVLRKEALKMKRKQNFEIPWWDDWYNADMLKRLELVKSCL